ncbi:MAG: hypothetical protein GY722_15355 [bacterium]|nr:hypothetical protein [bacterium]
MSIRRLVDLHDRATPVGEVLATRVIAARHLRLYVYPVHILDQFLGFTAMSLHARHTIRLDEVPGRLKDSAEAAVSL